MMMRPIRAWRAVWKKRQVADVMARFELVIESSVEGVRKPDSAIYQLACSNLAWPPLSAYFSMIWGLI